MTLPFTETNFPVQLVDRLPSTINAEFWNGIGLHNAKSRCTIVYAFQNPKLRSNQGRQAVPIGIMGLQIQIPQLRWLLLCWALPRRWCTHRFLRLHCLLRCCCHRQLSFSPASKRNHMCIHKIRGKTRGIALLAKSNLPPHPPPPTPTLQYKKPRTYGIWGVSDLLKTLQPLRSGCRVFASICIHLEVAALFEDSWRRNRGNCSSEEEQRIRG